MKLNIPEYISSIKPYEPGKPIEELEREYRIKDSIKLASNENPLGPSPKAVSAVADAIKNLHRYPDGSGYYLIRKLADKIGVSERQVVLGNGSDDVIGLLARAFLQPGDQALMTEPSFLMYEIFVRSVGAEPVFVPLKSLEIDLEKMADSVSSQTKMIFINNPNNPTGTFINKEAFTSFLDRIPKDIVIVLDEAYIEFADDPSCMNGLTFISDDRPLAVLRTFSKAYGLAGIRIGYGVMPEEVAGLLNRIRQPFNTNLLAQAAAIGALDDNEFLTKTIDLIQTELPFLQSSLRALGIKSFPTQANFFLINVGKDANLIYEEMLKAGVIVRSMVSYGYPEYIRVNVGVHEENVRFLNVFEKVIKSL